MSSTLTFKKSIVGYLFITPQLLMLILFHIYPIIEGIRVSMFRITHVGSDFVGFGNYIDLLSDPIFIRAVSNTLIYVFSVVTLTLVFGLFVASAIFDKNAKYVSFIRGCYYLPFMVSMVVMAMVWNFLLNPATGLFNYLLRTAGFPISNLLGNPSTVIPVIILVTFTSNVGQTIVLFVAAMIGVPTELFEAAEIDGASRLARLFYVLIPIIRPTILFITVINIIALLRMFVAVQLLTAGGPNNASVTMMFNLYQNAFLWNRPGLASAIGVLIFLLAILFSLPVFKILNVKD